MSDATQIHLPLETFSSKASKPRQNCSAPWARAFCANMSPPKAWMVESSTMSASPKRGHFNVVAKEQAATMLLLTVNGRDKASPATMLRGPP
eukprot:9012830-Pyramimonas_sp.AAC.1